MKHIFKFLIVFFFSYTIGRAQTPSKKHIVKKGETVYKISRKYYVSVSDIFDLNPGSRDIIKIGQVIRLPESAIIREVPSAGNSVTTGNNTIIYKVKRGDSKFVLSRRFGLSITELERQNPQIVKMLLAGAVLQIKGSTIQNSTETAAVSSTETTTESESESESESETVTPPTQLSKFVLHVVLKGQTLWGLARDNDISVNALRAANTDLLRGVLKAGQDLRIPTSNTSVATATTTSNSTTEEVTEPSTTSNGYTTYIVQKGDTKFGLANRVFNTTIKELERLNPKIRRMLIAGHEIIVPSNAVVESAISSTTQTETEVTTIETDTVSGTTPVEEIPTSTETAETTTETEETTVETDTVSETTPVEEIPTSTETEETTTDTEDVSTPVETQTEGITENTAATEEASEQTDGYINYTIKPKETLYGLARRAGMPIKDFLELNPQLSESVNTGAIIRMPGAASTSSEALVTGPTASELLASKHANLTTSIDVSKTINLNMVLPFSTSAYNSYSTSSIDFHRVLDDHTKKHLEFYRGARIAIDSINNLGVNLNVKILDDSITEIDSAAHANTNSIIIAPYYNSEKQNSLSLISNKNAPIVTATSELGNLGFTNVYEALPSINAQRLKMLNYMDRKNGNIIVINDNKREESKAFIAANTNNAKFLEVKKNGTFSNDELITLLDPNRINFVIIDSEKNNTFLSSTNVLLTQLSKNDIQLAVLDASIIPDNTKVSKKRFSILKMLYPSLTTPSKTISYIKFINKYTKEYGGKPPESALIGFDITFDTLLRLSQVEDFKTTSNTITEYLTLKFNYKQYASGNYYNDGIYILNYDTSDAIKVAD